MIRKMLVLLFIAIFSLTSSNADTIWVMCQPDSYVNIRSKPSGRSRTEGYALCGYDLETDCKTRNGFLHVYGSFEAGEGWISEGYIVWDEPIKVDQKYSVCSKGRLAVRKNINGKRSRWCYTDDVLMVYWLSDEWAVTNKGFVKSEFLEACNGEQ